MIAAEPDFQKILLWSGLICIGVTVVAIFLFRDAMPKTEHTNANLENARSVLRKESEALPEDLRQIISRLSEPIQYAVSAIQPTILGLRNRASLGFPLDATYRASLLDTQSSICKQVGRSDLIRYGQESIALSFYKFVENLQSGLTPLSCEEAIRDYLVWTKIITLDGPTPTTTRAGAVRRFKKDIPAPIHHVLFERAEGVIHFPCPWDQANDHKVHYSEIDWEFVVTGYCGTGRHLDWQFLINISNEPRSPSFCITFIPDKPSQLETGLATILGTHGGAWNPAISPTRQYLHASLRAMISIGKNKMDQVVLQYDGPV